MHDKDRKKNRGEVELKFRFVNNYSDNKEFGFET